MQPVGGQAAGGVPFTLTVQPLACNEATAYQPTRLGDDDVPPFMPKVPLLWPAVSMETRTLSTLVWSRAQFRHALAKSVATHVSNMFAGKDPRLLQPFQVLKKVVAEEKSRGGNEVKLVQICQAQSKLIPELTSKLGKDVKPEHCIQAKSKFTPELTSKLGKDVKPKQYAHVDEKFSPLLMLIAGKDVKPEHNLQVWVKSVPELVSIIGKFLRFEHPFQALVKFETPVESTQGLHPTGGHGANGWLPLTETVQPLSTRLS